MTGYIFNAYFLEFYSFLKVFIFFTFNGILTESAIRTAIYEVIPSWFENTFSILFYKKNVTNYASSSLVLLYLVNSTFLSSKIL